MEIFGIGGPELLVLLFLAGVVLGPQRLVKLARQAGNVVREVQTLTRNLSKELNREVDLLEVLEGKQPPGDPGSTAHSAQPASAEGDQEARQLPEAYLRFREDFPDEGELADAPATTARGNGQAGKDEKNIAASGAASAATPAGEGSKTDDAEPNNSVAAEALSSSTSDDNAT